MNNSYITIIKEKRTDLSRKRIPLNQNKCTADFRMSVPFEQNLHVKSREGTRQISKAVFTTPKEEELLKELITDGVTVEIRQVPSDSVIYAKDVL